MQQISLIPIINERPSHYAERLSKYYASKTNQFHKKNLGQFFTPLLLSNFIASFSTTDKRKVRILDPGCGTCILSSSLIEKLSENKKLKIIELTTFEIDPKLNIYTAASLSHLNDWLTKKGLTLKINHRSVDFINANYAVINSLSYEKFDIIISNPPYFKISKLDERKNLFKTLSNGQLNIYAVFAAISAHMLNINGELLFIIPRSFASGEYFKNFRKIFFSSIQVEKIHLFVSRKEAFDDKILQENLIIKGHRVTKIDLRKRIEITQSNGLKDINKSTKKEFSYAQLIDLNSDEKFLYLPNSDEQEKVMTLIKRQKNTLQTLGYKVSTGPIVYFRKTQFLQKNRLDNSVPLYWLDNVKKFNITHPMNGKSKEQFFSSTEKSNSVLIKNSNLVLVRRFSSKDEVSRLVAAPHFKKTLPEYEKIGIENKLNYIVKKEGDLSLFEVLGICSILNSYVYDEYFKTFNGNTQVSASELKKIPFPNFKKITEIGKKVSQLGMKDSQKINKIVSKALVEKISNEKN
ncbi:MAG: Eco57I restriction-modification methylase domain-containing protein [Bacteroidota bacterium]|nr:Eco57I restriction-modification methylase domain-containing protein [Bacteroidota bacterium]